MSEPFPNLAAHMSYEHHFHVDLVDELEPLELLDLHDDEHRAGYRGHSHEEPV